MTCVLVAAGRLGGMDLLLPSLVLQTVRPDLLVVVDGLWQFRRAAMAEAAKVLPFEVRHIPPAGNPWPRSAPARYLNTGLRECREDRGPGDVVLVVPDWTWLRPTALADHLYANGPGVHSATSDVGSVEAPPSTLLGYGDPVESGLGVPGVAGPSSGSGVRRLVDDVYAGRLQDHMMSCLASQVGPYTSLPALPPSAGNALVSYRLEAIMSVDGFDERYDGGRPGLLHAEADGRLRDQVGDGSVALPGAPRGWRAVCRALPSEEVVRPASANLELLQWSARYSPPRAIAGIRLLPVG